MTAFRAYVVLIALLALSGLVQAQVLPTASHSYVVEQMPRDGLTSVDLTTPTTLAPATVRYLDGLGRPAQQVLVRGGADGATDLVNEVTTYDDYGRAKLTYLPAPGGTGGSWLTSPLTNGGNFYGDTYPFAETEYEASPLNRPTKQWGPGRAWRTNPAHPATMAYGVASSNTVVRFSVSATAIFGATTEGGSTWNYFGAQDIATRTLTNEQNNVTVEYTDVQGRLVRRDVQTGSSTLTTAYVYDGFERLGAVIPPKLYDWLLNGANRTLPFVSNNAANPLFKDNAFVYQYDGRGRLLRKHVASAGWTDLIYDLQDRPVMSQDEQDRAEGQWRYMRYDGLSRVVETGRLALNRSASELRTDFTAVTGEAFPATVNPPEASQLTTSQYDTYTGALAYQPGGALATPWPAATGLLTRSRVRNLETGAWYESAMWYDDKGRTLQAQNQQVRGGTDRTDMAYRFNGEVLQRVLRHQPTAGAPASVQATTYSYDHVGRKTGVSLSLDGDSQRLATYHYDGVGRLVGKDLGGGNGQASYTNTSNLPAGTQQQASQFIDFVPGSLNENRATGGTDVFSFRIASVSPVQSLVYSYHIRGGLRGINLDGTDSPSLSGGRLFAMKLGYEEDGQYYDGNIRAQSWRTGRDAQLRTYSYSYDGASRLRGAGYSGAAGENYTTDGMSYDANGNLLSLNRTGVDALSYRYGEGNKLLAVSDGTNNATGFVDGNTSGDDYAYDGAGSLTKDLNRGISGIAYNLLKLPKRITFTNGKVVAYQYDAGGQKLRMSASDGSVREYVGANQYLNGSLFEIAHEEGRYTPGGGYEWFLSDHLGNVRVVVGDKGVAQAGQYTDYDPWGLALWGNASGGSSTNRSLYNGKEAISEVGGGVLDYGARLYDAPIGRMHTVDRFTEKSTSMSGYQYAGNNPVMNIDSNGDSLIVFYKDADGNQQRLYYGYTDDSFDEDGNAVGGYGFYSANGKLYTGKDSFVNKLSIALAKLGLGSVGRGLVNNLSSAESVVTVSYGKNAYSDGANTVTWNPDSNSLIPTEGGSDGVSRSKSFIGLGHELAHAEDDLAGTLNAAKTWEGSNGTNYPEAEKYSTHRENQIRGEQRLPLRTHYGVMTTETGGFIPDPMSAVIDKIGNSLFYKPMNYKKK